MRRFACVVSGIMLCSAFVLCFTCFNVDAQKGPVEIRWAASATGAALFPLSTAMVEDLKKNIPEVARTSSAVPTSGPVGNVMLVSRRQKGERRYKLQRSGRQGVGPARSLTRGRCEIFAT